MLLQIKPLIFLNELEFEIKEMQGCTLKAVLKDDRGHVYNTFEKEHQGGGLSYKWEGLNDLPYGVYTFEASGGTDAVKARLVKRI